MDKGTAHTDSLEIERERGISVKAAEAAINYKDIEIHIIDTPGHVDFSAEVERALRVLDGAIIVISAVEGVQPQTEIYFRALKALNIPTLFFINKVDRMGADIHRVKNEIIKNLTSDVIEIQQVEVDNDSINIQSTVHSENTYLIEFIAERNEEILTGILLKRI